MSRQSTSQAQSTFQQANNFGNTSSANAGNLYGELMPAYSAEATNPQGFGAPGLAAINTAAQQSSGGGESGAVGAGNLIAARTRNSAGLAPAADNAAQSAMRTNSENALNVQESNELLKQQQQQEGLKGLSGLYGTNTSDVLGSLGLENQATNANTAGGQSGWFQNLTGLINAVAGAGKAVSSFTNPGGGGCYVAAELYGGWFKPETVAIRAYLSSVRHPIGVLFVAIYSRYGKSWAQFAREHSLIRRGFKIVFDNLLKRAQN